MLITGRRIRDGRTDQTGTGGRGVPQAPCASGRAQGRAEHRHDEPDGVLPELPEPLVRGSRRRKGGSTSTRRPRARWSTGCPMPSGRRSIRPRRARSRRRPSRNPTRDTESHGFRPPCGRTRRVRAPSALTRRPRKSPEPQNFAMRPFAGRSAGKQASSRVKGESPAASRTPLAPPTAVWRSLTRQPNRGSRLRRPARRRRGAGRRACPVRSAPARTRTRRCRSR
jgi:hypothetical protein